MPPAIAFGPFRLDLDRQRLMRGETRIELRPKAWEVLRHLCERPDVVVTSDELLDAVWPGVAVTPQTVTNVIREIRLALADRAGAPRWIRTIRGRGHVFTRATADESEPAAATAVVVGRDRERQRLAAAWARAPRDGCRVVFVTGEPGIGKTTLLESFARGLGADVRHARGAGVEQHGPPESFLPLLNALEQLAIGPPQRTVVALLRRTAPTWLLRLPSLLRPAERLRIAPSLVGATATRMLREGLAAMRALAELGPLVLFVEDLHWADPATLDFLAALARDPRPARLLVIATFRPVDAARRAHPVALLARELVHERRAEEIALQPFDATDVAAYVQARLGGTPPPPGLAERLEGLSAGNPLFLRALVDELSEAGTFATFADDADRLLDELPESLRAFVASEAARLPHRLRRLLEAASLIGDAVLVPELAAALGRPVKAVADDCEQLAATGRVFRRAGQAPWHDGSSVGRYAFPHASHRRIVHDALPVHDRRELHRRLAAGLESAYGPAAPTIAVRLAAHCEQAGLGARAVDYHELAAAAAEERCAYAEAAAHLAAARARLDAAAGPGGDRSPRAGFFSLRLGEALVLAHGYSRPEVEATYLRALDVFERAEIPLGIFTAEMGLAVVDLTRARPRDAHDRTARLAAIAAAADPALGVIAACWAGFASSALGELARAVGELEAGIANDGDPPLPRNFSVARMLRSQLALVHTVRGDLEAAARCERDALARSRRHGGVSERAHAALLAAERAVFLRDAGRAAFVADAVALADANGLASYLALLRAYEAALRPEWPPTRRRATLHAVLVERQRLGDRWHHGLLLGLLAETALEDGDVDAARHALDAAFAHVAATDERYYEAELYRVRAACARAVGAGSETSQWLERAQSVARRQGAGLWEARAAAPRTS